MTSEQTRIIRRILRVNHSGEHGAMARLLSFVVASATEILIYTSTRGDSLKLRSAMRAHAYWK